MPALRFLVGEEFSNIPLFGVSIIGIVSGIAVGIITVLLAASSPAKRAAKVSPIAAVSAIQETQTLSGIRFAHVLSKLKRPWVFTMQLLQGKT